MNQNLLKPHDEYEINNSVCNNIDSGFGRVSTLDPTYLEYVHSYDIFDHIRGSHVLISKKEKPPHKVL